MVKVVVELFWKIPGALTRATQDHLNPGAC